MSQSHRLDRRQFVGQCAAGVAAAALPPSARAGLAAADGLPPCRGPLAMWALTGTLPSADVCRQLDAFARAGWGVVLYPRWGLELEYLGEAWFERIAYIVAQAAQRSIEVWLYDEFCWPSGHAKGLVTEDHPDLAAQVLCVDRDGASRIERLPASANLLMPEATQRFLALTHQRYAAAIGSYFGSTVRAIFTDEPSLSAYHQAGQTGPAAAWRLPWSAGLDQALGGDFPRKLAAAGAQVAAAPLWRDYWAAYARTYHDAWTAPIAAWCRAHGIALSGHLMGESSFGSHVFYYGSLRRQLAEFGIPGIDEINTRWEVERCEALTLATIAEFPGRERMVEAFALGPCYLPLETMRKMVDLCAACGVDRYVLAICPHDLRGNFFSRKYLGIHGVQQPWFQECARPFAEYVIEAAERAHQAKPLGIAWPAEEELWAAAGPDPRQSKTLAALTAQCIETAREAIRARLPSAPAAAAGSRRPLEAPWTFAPRGLNSLRIDKPSLVVIDRPSTAELSVQMQLVKSLKINGAALDLAAAPADADFDLSYRRLPVAELLRPGENRLEIESSELRPLPFLPALVLWGRFAVDPAGRLIAPPQKIHLGDWRSQGYPALSGIGRYQAVVAWDSPPKRLIVDSGGYPAKLVLNGRDCGRRLWGPWEFDLHGAARPGKNELVVEITSTLGHLFLPAAAPAVGLLGAWISP